jgi:hypothetical protein
MDLSLSIAIGSSVQIALFVAPVLVFASLFIGPTLLDLAFPAGLVLMVLLSVLRLSPWHARPRFPDRDDKDADEDITQSELARRRLKLLHLRWEQKL